MNYRTYTIPAAFTPVRSLLGRIILRQVRDPRRAESMYFVSVAALAVFLIVAHSLAWAFLQPISSGDQTSFAIATGVAAVVFGLVCLVGRRPEIRVGLDETGLSIRQGNEAHRVAWTRIRCIEKIDARQYHRRYARYEATDAYVNQIHPELVHIELPDRDLFLGLTPGDLLAFLEITRSRPAAAVTSSQVA